MRRLFLLVALMALVAGCKQPVAEIPTGTFEAAAQSDSILMGAPQQAPTTPTAPN
ncbi:MAG TPA: hypothetical protein PKD86_18790 [Gemmatales bacterium]|nr:hypothetical protein [Gemmatales bacterium]HMP61393.1 hypothetical protein [Gemmatales bacterium]